MFNTGGGVLKPPLSKLFSDIKPFSAEKLMIESPSYSKTPILLLPIQRSPSLSSKILLICR
jgi:hypothetical protein